MKAADQTVAVLIPVYHPDKKLKKLLSMLRFQTCLPDRVIITETVDEGQKAHTYSVPGLVIDVYSIRREDFDHAGTRSFGMDHVNEDICICMTQDAIPADEHLIEELILALRGTGPNGEVIGAAYARQLPQKGCSLVERFTRSFNYPEKSSVKTAADLETLGIKTYFCSNVCAAYDMSIYRRLGGFGQHEVFNEDMIYAAHLIKAGYAIAYAARAKVFHSHDYTLAQQFHRNFDLAASQAMHPEIFSEVSSESEGVRLVADTAEYLVHEGKPWLIPGLVAQSGAKYMGYRLGLMYKRLPRSFIIRFTANKGYWEKDPGESTGGGE